MNNSALLILFGLLSVVHAAEPIRLHPDNPRLFQWRGKTVALITSAEHYGAVINQAFDWRRYLETLHRDGMNYTRVFAGSYVEPPGAFGIQRNTLAPAPGRFLAPWARSDQPGYAGGGNKFDLDRFSLSTLERLKEFLAEAGKRGIVVELTFFCSTYGAQQWAVHPMNPTNNVQRVAVTDWRKLNTSANSVAVMAIQEKLTRWLVRELNDFDNLFYEIQNEPWADNSTMGDYINPYLVDQHRWPNAVQVPAAESVAWQRRIAQAIVAEEDSLPRKHLIAQNVANFRLALRDEDLVPEASVINFHYAYPEALDWNRGMGRVIGYDETGFAGGEDATYRSQAWNFMLGGGGLFNNLDYSFSVGAEDGTDTTNKAPGGGSPSLRKQLGVLSVFLHGFDLARLNPDRELIRRAPGVVTQVLSEPGRAYAIYARGRGPTEISLVLPKGQWAAQWVATDDGRVLKEESIAGTGAVLSISSPAFSDDIALRITRIAERERAQGVFSVKPDNTGTLLDGEPFLAIGLRIVQRAGLR